MMAKRPMVCVTDVDGRLFPLGGNMRLKALQELKYKDIPDEWVMLADDWTEEQRNEFIIKDNVSFGEWNWDDLSADWDTDLLSDWGLDVPEDEEKIDKMLLSKRKMSDDILDKGGDALLTELSNEEIVRVVSLDLSKSLAEET